MKLKKTVAALVVCLLPPIPLAFADSETPVLRPPLVQMPNDIEQEAMYCATVLKLRRSDLVALSTTLVGATDDPDIRKLLEDSGALMKKVIAKLDDDLNRINSFLVPRLPYLERNAMFAASSRGEADFASQKQSPKVRQCADRCMSVETQQRGACLKSCLEEDDLNRRLSRCSDLSFLPY